MSGRVDASDPAISDAIADLKSGSETNWILLTHVPKSDTKLKVAETGTGGLEEIANSFNDGKVMFGLVIVPLGVSKKYVYIAWCGEGVTGMKKGLFNNQAQDVSFLFKGFHVQVNARSDDDLDADTIMGKLKSAAGASFYQDHASQSNESTPTASSITYEKANEDQSTESKPMASSIRYEQANQDQSTESRPMASAIRYEQANQDQSTESKPVSSRFPQASRGGVDKPPVTGRVQPPPQQAPVPPRPAQAAPPPPVAEETYHQEEAPYEQDPYQEGYQEEQYQEEQYQEGQYQEEYQEGYQEEQYQEGAYQEEQGAVSGGGGGTCVALFDYDAENEDDLSFKEGDVITVLDKSDPSGWWEGEVNGRRGFFPSNFVEEQ